MHWCGSSHQTGDVAPSMSFQLISNVTSCVNNTNKAFELPIFFLWRDYITKEPNRSQKVVTSGCEVITSGPEKKCVERGTPTFGINIKLENIRMIFQTFDQQHLKYHSTTYRNSETTQRCGLLTDHSPAKCRLKIFLVLLTHDVTFRIHWNNIDGATSPAWCELPHQCIHNIQSDYKQCITGKSARRPPDHAHRHYGSPGRFVGHIWGPGDRIYTALLLGSRIFVNTAIKLNIIRSTCYRLRVRSHMLLSGIQIACVLHLSLVKFQQKWSQGVASLEKMPLTRCQKLPQRLLRQKRGSPNSRLASAYYILNNALPWKQCHVTTLLSSMNSACAQRSACWPSEAFLYQTFVCW